MQTALLYERDGCPWRGLLRGYQSGLCDSAFYVLCAALFVAAPCLNAPVPRWALRGFWFYAGAAGLTSRPPVGGLSLPAQWQLIFVSVCKSGVPPQATLVNSCRFFGPRVLLFMRVALCAGSGSFIHRWRNLAGWPAPRISVTL